MTVAAPDLVARAQSGDPGAVRRLVEALRAPAVAIALAHGLPPKKAYETAESSLTRLLAQLNALRDESGCRRELVRTLNSSAPVAPRPENPAPLAELVATGAVQRQRGRGVVVRGDLDRAIDAMLLAGPVDTRNALALRTYAGLPYAEIAALLGIPTDEVAARLARATAAITNTLRVDPVPRSEEAAPRTSDCPRPTTIAALTDQELLPLETERISRHLRACPACRTARADAVAVRRTLQAGLRTRAPVADLSRLTERVLAIHTLGLRSRAARREALPGLELQSPLGTGGMGTVFRARQTHTERTVAVKILRPELAQNPIYVERFLREARAAAALNHAHIVRIFDVGQHQGLFFQVMELVEGQSLDHLLEDGPLPLPLALSIARSMASALQHAEAHGIVHRDVKPANILLEDETRRAKLTDLGLARREDPASTSGTLTIEGTVLGTPNYMPPEQAHDTHIADHRADVYALGATLYHMVTGLVPFGTGSPVEILARVVNLPLRLPEDLAAEQPDLARVLHHAVQPDPDRRYASASLLLEDLDRLIRSTPPIHAPRSGDEPPAPYANRTTAPTSARNLRARLSRRPPPTRKPRSGALLIVAVAAGALGLALAVRALRSRGDGTPTARRRAAPASTRLATRSGEHAKEAGEEADAAERSSDAGARTREAMRVRDARTLQAHADAAARAAADAVGDAESESHAANRPHTSALAEALTRQRQGDLRGALVAARRALRAAPPERRAEATALVATLEAARERERTARIRAEALAAYRPVRASLVANLAALDIPAARKRCDAATSDPNLAAIADTLALDRADLARLAALRTLVEAGLQKKIGVWVSLAPLASGAPLEGRLREEGGALYVRQADGSLRAVRPGALASQTTLALARAAAAASSAPAARSEAEATGDAVGLDTVAALRCVRGEEGAPAALEAWSRAGAPPAAVAALEAKRALAEAAELAAQRAEAERRATLALRRADRAWGRAGRARPSKRSRALREAAQAYQLLLQKHGETDAVKARRAEIDARIAEGDEAPAEAKSGAAALLQKLLQAEVQALPNGRTRCTYRFDPNRSAKPLDDWRTVDSINNRQLRNALESPGLNANARAPAPYDRTKPWTLTKDGLLGTGWDRLVWKAKLKGDVAVEVRAIPLHPRNLIVTLRDDGAREYYGAALAFSLPALPTMYRTSFPDLYALFDRWKLPQNAVFRSRGFPDLEELETGPPSPLPRRRLILAAAARQARKDLVTVRLTLGRGAFRGEDTSAAPAGGSIGLAAWNSAILFERVTIEGEIDPAWVEAEAKRRGLTTGGGTGTKN